MNAWNAVSEFFVNLGSGLIEKLSASAASVSGFFAGIGDGIKSAIGAAVDFVSLKFNAISDTVSGAWGAITSAFSSGGLLGVFQSIGSAILNFVLAPLDKVLGMLTWVPFVGDDIASWQGKISELRSGGGMDSLAFQAPTKTESMASSYSESVSTSRVEIGVEKGATASVVGSIAPNVTVERRASGF